MTLQLHPLQTEILFHLGPVPITSEVTTTWAIMAVLVAISWLAMRHAKVKGGWLQTVVEVAVEAIADQVEAILRVDPWKYLPLLATLFIYLVFANLSGMLPGVEAPTAHIETPAALALIVFFSVQFYGLRSQGLKAYAKRYLEPNPLLLPLNLVSQVTRSFSLMMRLFGNMMSHELVLAIILFLAGLFVPVPFMLLGILIGLIQAFIFTVLATVYIGGAVGGGEAG
ncbi:F0F1 ATP synthase subunit A [Methyloligella sp. 2.7D]|uniref:F0F1 ATP synthase subunit A n=1 Tax=unclassified Methyloligella TaxID=2625955 RepID=UPI00157C36F5|nr:F0F1 ATP synthase subunit A [Methyloligella sp. GL2]QKP78127.1 F0F1 ATP synthase subunit A [Methyloligella sp. GL2]